MAIFISWFNLHPRFDMQTQTTHNSQGESKTRTGENKGSSSPKQRMVKDKYKAQFGC